MIKKKYFTVFGMTCTARLHVTYWKLMFLVRKKMYYIFITLWF